MACDCETYECLNIVQNFADCPDVVELDLKATATETLNWMYEFNGRWFGGTVDTTSGDNITLPFVFNENYVHTIKFLRNNVLVNDTCYKLDTSGLAGNYTTNNSTGNKYLPITATADSNIVSNDLIANRKILTVATDNATYTTFVSFTQAGNSFTMTNGTSFYTGQSITLIFA